MASRWQHCVQFEPQAGAYLGGDHWAMAPPLGCQDCIISIEKDVKIVACPPFVTWADSLSTETVGEDIFGAKNRTKFELKLFFLVFTKFWAEKWTWF